MRDVKGTCHPQLHKGGRVVGVSSDSDGHLCCGGVGVDEDDGSGDKKQLWQRSRRGGGGKKMEEAGNRRRRSFRARGFGGCAGLEQPTMKDMGLHDMKIQLVKATMDSLFELSLQRIGVDILGTSAPPTSLDVHTCCLCKCPRGKAARGRC